MYSWLNVRPFVLDEMVSHDGPGDLQLNLCNSCLNHQSTTLYCCLECSHSSLYCNECIVKMHKLLLLHRLEVHFFFTQYCHTHVTSSAGRTGSSTKPPSIWSGLFVISGTMVTHAPFSLHPTTSLLSTPTGGIKYELHSVPVTPPYGIITTDNYFVCAGTQCLSNVPDLLFPSTSLTHITKSLSRES